MPIHFGLRSNSSIGRHLRACCHRSLQACCLQQEVHHLLPRNPDLVSRIACFCQQFFLTHIAVSASSCPANSPSTLFLRVPRLSPSTPRARNKLAVSLSVFLCFFSLGHRICSSFGCHDETGQGLFIPWCLLMQCVYGWSAFFWGQCLHG